MILIFEKLKKGMTLGALFAMISNKWAVMSDFDNFQGGKTKASMGIWVSQASLLLLVLRVVIQ